MSRRRGNKTETTQKHFELFKKWCRYYIKKFSLSGWRFDFYLTNISTTEHQTEVIVDYSGCVVTVNFHIEIVRTSGETYEEVINYFAKHEMMHILIGNLAELAESRYITSDEIDKAQEELVYKLCDIIT